MIFTAAERRDARREKKRSERRISRNKRRGSFGGLLVTRTAATYQIAPAFAFSETLVEVRGLVSGHIPRALLVVLFLELRRETNFILGKQGEKSVSATRETFSARARREKKRATTELFFASFGRSSSPIVRLGRRFSNVKIQNPTTE